MATGRPGGASSAPRWSSGVASAEGAALSARRGRSAFARDLAEQRPRDHEPLDLARALVDLGHLRVAVVALGRELLRVAVAAEDLDRLPRPLARDAAREQL